MSMKAKIKELEAQLKELKSAVPTMKMEGLTVKVGEKGNLVIYGINSRFPVSLYVNQAQKIQKLLNSPELQAFVESNASSLSFEKVTITE